MSETITATLPLRRWQGEKATYHLVGFEGEEADALSGYALMQRLEFGRRGGFGSIKVMAAIGGTEWKTSVFPQKASHDGQATRSETPSKTWILLVSKKVMRAEDLAPGDQIAVSVTPL